MAQKFRTLRRTKIFYVGAMFGLWELIKPYAEQKPTPCGQKLWQSLCRCQHCGVERLIYHSNLAKGVTKSCHRPHGGTSDPNVQPDKTGKRRTGTYRSWANMLARCEQPSSPNYSYYGGSGICVATRWHKFENFLVDMGERPLGKTLDRYPNNAGNYEPGNCRWATSKEQALNKRDKHV